MTNRRLARECALEVMYRLDLVADDPDSTIEEIVARKNPSDDAESYLRRLVAAVQTCQQEIDAALRRHLRRWRLERLTVIDRAILRVAAAELLYFADVPPKVAINEAVDIAKKFGDDEAGRFVNGVLDGVLRELGRAPEGR
ncbi:MAG: transcription antitermination factor NusB [candidate division WOR-3 bacterium]